MISKHNLPVERSPTSKPRSSPAITELEKVGHWPRAGTLLGLLLLAAVILVVRNLGEERRFLELVSKAQPFWLLLALVYQLITYSCAAGVWRIVLNRAGVRPPLRSLIPLGLAKLFVDQVVPTAGVGGSLLVVRGLVRRGASEKIATAALLIDLLSFYAAHAIAVGAAIFILRLHKELHPVVLLLATVFSVVALAIPISILWLTRRAYRVLPKWISRLTVVSRVADRVAEVPTDLIRNRRLFWQATVLQLAIFALDAATLDAALRAIGHPSRPDAVFAAFSMAMVTATVSLIPGGLGAFEGSSVLMLRFLNIPIEAGLAATLLLRGFTLWLPMVPGLFILRHERNQRNANPRA